MEGFYLKSTFRVDILSVLTTTRQPVLTLLTSGAKEPEKDDAPNPCIEVSWDILESYVKLLPTQINTGREDYEIPGKSSLGGVTSQSLPVF